MNSKLLPSQGFAIIDTETTGLKPGPDRVIEVAVVLMNLRGEVTDHWDTLINPRRNVAGTQIHGITTHDVVDAPFFEDIAPYMASLMQGRVIVAHNAPFDTRFLAMEFAKTGISVKKENFLCTLSMSRRKFPTYDSHKLEFMTKQFGITLKDAHAAIADTMACAELFAELCKTNGDFWAPKTATDFVSTEVGLNGMEDPIGFSRLPDFECNHCPLDKALMPW